MDYLSLRRLAYLWDKVKAYVSSSVSGKQDTINDLSDIRSGASAGATAYQKPVGGIGLTDLSEEVQASLSKADSALQGAFVEVNPVDGCLYLVEGENTPAQLNIPRRTSELDNDAGFISSASLDVDDEDGCLHVTTD